MDLLQKGVCQSNQALRLFEVHLAMCDKKQNEFSFHDCEVPLHIYTPAEDVLEAFGVY